jgi:hypothetical protein
MPEGDAYLRNTKGQYEALGRFVEAFEAMVESAKTNCIAIQSGDADRFQTRLIATPLHHPNLNAKTIFEIFRSVVAYAASDENFRATHGLDEEDASIVFDALRTISGEYEKLASKRNNLLHGTWYIGYRGSDDPDSTEFQVNQFKLDSSGVSTVLDLPKDASGLLNLSKRCEAVRQWIEVLSSCVLRSRDDMDTTLTIKSCFRISEKQLMLIWPSLTKLPAA